MDPHTFDGMTRRLSGSLSRRSLVGGSLGAAALAAAGLDDDRAGARQRKKNRVGAAACIPTGKRCPAKKPRGKDGKTLKCGDCCQGITVTVTNAKGKQVRKCACKPQGSVCAPDKAHQCCSGVCGDGVCQATLCQDVGNLCTVGAECCSGFCFDDVCQPGICLELGAECVDAEECCSGACQAETPQSPEVCCLDEGAACDVGDDQCCVGLACDPRGSTCQVES